jgi:serine protease AprX
MLSITLAEKLNLDNLKTNLDDLLESDELNSREIIEFNRDIDRNNEEIEKLLQKPNVLSAKDRESLYDLLWNTITYFNNLLKQNKFDDRDIDRIVIDARNQHIALLQRTRLLIGDRNEISIALLWMGERGEHQEDLIAIKNLDKNSTLTPDELQALTKSAKSAEDCITQHLRSVDRLPQYYQVVCSQDDFNEFASEVYLIYSCPSFCFVLAPEKVVKRIKQRYAVGRWDIKDISRSSSEEPTSDLDRSPNDVTNRLKQQIRETNAEIIAPLGRGEFVLLVPDREVASKIRQMPEVSQLEPYKPKIDERLKYLDREEESLPARIGVNSQLERNRSQLAASGNAHFPGIWILIFFRQEDRERAAEHLKEHQIEIVGEEGDDTLVIDLIHYPHDWQQAFEAIESQSGLREIEEDSPASFFNDRAVPIIAEGVVPARNSDPIGSNSLNLTGAGETIGIADSGLDTGDIYNLHPDFQGRVEQIEDLGRSGTMYKYHRSEIDFCPIGADRYSGHGTHVAGSAIGSNVHSSQITNQIPPIQGMASEAKLFFQSRGYIKPQEQPIEEYFDTLNIAGILQNAYENRARIHSNSWGLSRRLCEYNSRSESIDKFMWNNKDFLVVVAAGNEGIHTDPNTTWIDSSNICSPGTAKNCLTVGASENDRTEEFDVTYGQRYERFQRFCHPPFYNNGIADSIDDIAAFSGRGPCGGRYKPDVIAPGTFVLSTRSSQIPQNEFGSAAYTPDRSRYMYMCGTSMATPLVAGGAALVRQYLKERRQIENPTAALVKATIIHSAQYIDRDRYPHLHENSYPWVDNEQGWGRVSLANSLRQKDDPIKVIFEQPFPEREGLLLGEWYEYQIEIVGDKPLRIILAYTDAPGAKLQNNLNLIVYNPKNKYYVGNYFDRDGEDEVDDKWLDNTNNVEGVVVESPEIGIWRIIILATEISEGKQDFALVASGEGLEIVSRDFYPNQEERDVLE